MAAGEGRVICWECDWGVRWPEVGGDSGEGGGER